VISLFFRHMTKYMAMTNSSSSNPALLLLSTSALLEAQAFMNVNQLFPRLNIYMYIYDYSNVTNPDKFTVMLTYRTMARVAVG
jgi:hypothetical protein